MRDHIYEVVVEKKSLYFSFKIIKESSRITSHGSPAVEYVVGNEIKMTFAM